MNLDEALKQKIVKNCKENKYSAFGSFDVKNLEIIDGWKYHFANDQWLMIRASGTEPVLRLYAESNNEAGARKILKETKETILWPTKLDQKNLDFFRLLNFKFRI